MKCEHVEELIPLYVGGDLEPPEADDLRQHLTSCAPCRQLNEDFQASQRWLTGFTVPEFDEASFATLRASVLSQIDQIEKQEKRGRWLNCPSWPNLKAWLLPSWNPRLALAVSAAVLVGVTGLSVATYRNQIAPPKTGEDRVSAATGRERKDFAAQSPMNNETKMASVVAGSKRRIHHSRRAASALLPDEAFNNGGFSNALEPPVIPEEPATEEVVPPESVKKEPEENEPKEMLRIELQTADPNIRIIWLTPKAPSQSDSKTK